MIYLTNKLFLFEIMNIRNIKQTLLSTKKILKELGKNIKLARLRRKLRAEQTAESANISRSTLWAIEKGSPSVAIGSYLQVLFILGLEKDVLVIARDDKPGRELRDAELLPRKRAPKKAKAKES